MSEIKYRVTTDDNRYTGRTSDAYVGRGDTVTLRTTNPDGDGEVEIRTVNGEGVSYGYILRTALVEVDEPRMERALLAMAMKTQGITLTQQVAVFQRYDAVLAALNGR